MKKVNWVCADCGNKALKLPINKNKRKMSVSTYHFGNCDVCNNKIPILVTEVRDFGYPIFEVSK